jgi:NAD(P)-dependent dehydrogenase (short-subunit alcohol dehydrogenase family)
MPTQSMKNKVLVVTGAASGIGAAVCRRFSREGTRIGLLDRDVDGVRAAADKLKAGGVDAVGIKCDVADEGECNLAVRQIIGLYGGIDILVNNAGITQRSAFLETKISVYQFFGTLPGAASRAALTLAARSLSRKGLLRIQLTPNSAACFSLMRSL